MRKLNFAVLLAMFTFMGGGKSYAHDIEVANADGVTIYYNFTNDQTELEVTYQGSYSGNRDYAGNVVIPESVTYEGKTYPVTSIGNEAFYECRGLTELTIGNCVTSIGENAFKYCELLTEVTIPNSVTSIGYQAFDCCWGLTELTIGNSVTSIGTSAFYGCSKLTELTIPNSVISIGNWAFDGCSGLTELTIPNSVTAIGDDAFFGCSGLTELTIPGNVTSIGEWAFRGCSGLEKITVESGNPNYDSRENCNAIIETNSNQLIAGCNNTIIPNSVTAIGSFAFEGCRGLTKMNIPNSVTSIGRSAFYDCDGLTEVTIGNSVTYIGGGAFNYCSGLTEVTIPNSVTSIESGTFSYCTSLTEVTIGNSVTSIGSSAFYACWNLTTLYSLSTTPPTAEGSTFYSSNYANADVFVPAEALEAYQTADVWKDFQKLHAIGGTTAVEKVSAAEQIQAANGQITVTGLTDGTTVAVYDLSGKQVGTATSKGGQVSISTGMTAGAAAIVKVGDKSVKTVMK